MEEVSAKTCRLCLNKNINLNNVFEKSPQFRFSPAELMCEMLQLVVSPDPKHAQKVCDECLKKMIDYKWFKDKCHRSWKFIEKFISDKCMEEQRSKNVEQSGPRLRAEEVGKHGVPKQVKQVPYRIKPKSKNVKYIKEEIYLGTDPTEVNPLPENECVNPLAGVGEEVNQFKIEEVPVFKDGGFATAPADNGIRASNFEDGNITSINESQLTAGSTVNPSLPILIGNVYSLGAKQQYQVGGSSPSSQVFQMPPLHWNVKNVVSHKPVQLQQNSVGAVAVSENQCSSRPINVIPSVNTLQQKTVVPMPQFNWDATNVSTNDPVQIQQEDPLGVVKAQEKQSDTSQISVITGESTFVQKTEENSNLGENKADETKEHYEVVEECSQKRKKNKVFTQNEPFECQVCHKKLNSKDGYQLHVTRHGWESGSYWPRSKNSRIEKPKKKSAVRKPGINGINHKKKKVEMSEQMPIDGREPPKKVMFDCDYCSKSFETQNEMLNHVQIHMGKHYVCGICNQTFKTKNMYNQHMNFHETGLRFRCFKCKASFADKTSMKAHRDTHRAPRRFGCLVCNKSFTSLNFLKKHMLIHDKKGDYECSECEKSFLTRIRLVCHMRSHKNQTFICDLCQKNFKDKRRLMHHIYAHLDYRPLKCKYCDKGFITPYEREKHEHFHEGNKCHTCELCGKGYVTKSALRTHLMGHAMKKIKLRMEAVK